MNRQERDQLKRQLSEGIEVVRIGPIRRLLIPICIVQTEHYMDLSLQLHHDGLNGAAMACRQTALMFSNLEARLSGVEN